MQGKDDLAIARLEALIASHPDMTSAAGLLAQVFDRRGDDKRASALRQWSRQKPEPEPVDPWMDSLMGDCYDTVLLGLKFEEYFAMGQITRALPFIDRIEELDPKSPVPELLRGWEQSSNHHEEEAVAEYEKALAKGADPEKICPYIVKSLVALKRIDDAERLMAEFYAKKPDSIPILEAYATVAVLRDDTRTARMLLAKVLEKEPYLNSANLNMAKILWSAGERDAAAVCLERLVEMNPADVASRALLGQYFLGNSEPGSAIVPLEQAVALENAQSPRYKSLTAMLYTAYLLAGNAESDRGHIADAVGKFYDKAIKLAPDDATAYASKAVACAQHKEFRSAADALETMTSLQPRNPTIYLSLGDVLYQEGYSEQARRNWQRALSLAPDGSTELRNAIGERLSGNITADTFR
jgi:Flp pilus assembly protein TadD